MKCENFLCVYEKDGVCTLENIELDVAGLCKECIYININADTLKVEKEQLRNKFNEKY